MRRVNIQAAFVGEPVHGQEGADAEGSDEAVVFTVRGGEMLFVVPAGTPDDRVLDAQGTVRGTLHLENEQVLTLEIQDGAVGAFVEHEPADLHRKREEGVGLFTLAKEVVSRPPEKVTAADLMKTNIVSIGPEASVGDAARLMAFHRVSGLPVIVDGKLAGVFTEADVLGSDAGARVEEVMTRDVISIPEDMPADEVASLLNEKRIRRVPVVRGETTVGILSRGDIVRWVASRGE